MRKGVLPVVDAQMGHAGGAQLLGQHSQGGVVAAQAQLAQHLQQGQGVLLAASSRGKGEPASWLG
jgi:hypothetical protein